MQLGATQNHAKGHKWPWRRTLDTPALEVYREVKPEESSRFTCWTHQGEAADVSRVKTGIDARHIPAHGGADQVERRFIQTDAADELTGHKTDGRPFSTC